MSDPVIEATKLLLVVKCAIQYTSDLRQLSDFDRLT